MHQCCNITYQWVGDTCGTKYVFQSKVNSFSFIGSTQTCLEANILEKKGCACLLATPQYTQKMIALVNFKVKSSFVLKAMSCVLPVCRRPFLGAFPPARCNEGIFHSKSSKENECYWGWERWAWSRGSGAPAGEDLKERERGTESREQQQQGSWYVGYKQWRETPHEKGKVSGGWCSCLDCWAQNGVSMCLVCCQSELGGGEGGEERTRKGCVLDQGEF